MRHLEQSKSSLTKVNITEILPSIDIEGLGEWRKMRKLISSISACRWISYKPKQSFSAVGEESQAREKARLVRDISLSLNMTQQNWNGRRLFHLLELWLFRLFVKINKKIKKATNWICSTRGFFIIYWYFIKYTIQQY